MLRFRVVLAIIGIVTALAGLAIRKDSDLLPRFIQQFAPDALWAFLVLTLLVFWCPCWPMRRAALVALGFAFLIEFSQLMQTPLLRELRATRPGGLVLGHGFLWSDLLCYTAGICLGALVLRKMRGFFNPVGENEIFAI